MKGSITILKRYFTQLRAREKYNFDTTIKVTIPETSKVLEIHPIWLRHHCQCEQCYNPKTFQKMLIPSHLPDLSLIQDLATSSRSNSLQIQWKDGHISTFNLNFLEKTFSKIANLKDSQQDPFVPFNYEGIHPPLSDPLQTSIPYETFMHPDNTGLAQLLSNIVTHGYGIVNHAPPDFESTKKVVLRISHPQTTLYGDFSEWTSNLAHADTAYTSDYVHLHTDTTYFSEPMGLQMFHCLKHEGTGGINSIVDGFQIAKRFYTQSPQLHATLSSANIRYQYLDPGKYHYHSLDTALKHNFLAAVERIRYNPHDMATIDTIPFHLITNFYTSLVTFSQELEKSPVWLKLSPGLIIFLDNWRVLHGRSAFTGLRHLCGAYIARSDWLSKARLLQVID